MPGAIVIGAGPGIGTSVARRFAREGLAVGVLARSPGTVGAALAALAGLGAETAGVSADVTDEPALRAALDEVVDRVGVPEVLVYNAALIQSDALGELSAQQHLDAWAVNVVGAITAVAHLGPAMAQAGRGTILLTGGMPEPVPDVTSLSLGKAGVRALAHLARGRTSPPASTSRPSPSPAPWRPVPRSTPTRSPSSTGGCTPSRAAPGSARSSTRGPLTPRAAPRDDAEGRAVRIGDDREAPDALHLVRRAQRAAAELLDLGHRRVAVLDREVGQPEGGHLVGHPRTAWASRPRSPCRRR